MMEMLYKDDWEEARRHLEAWWAGSCLDRAAIRIGAPRKQPLPGDPAPPAPADLMTRWTDPEYRVAAHDHAFRHTFYGGESIPSLWVNLGPGVMAGYLGSELTFAPGTVWFGQVIHDWSRDQVRFDPHNRWWQETLRATRIATEAARGKFFVGLTDLGGVIDVLAHLRGSENLLVDMAERRQEIKAVRDRLVSVWQQCYLELESIIHQHLEGTACWIGTWAPGRTYNIQCDFCCMISSATFEEYVAPELEALCRFLDHTTYHLDGPGAVHHLDRLLDLPGLHGIQWTPGSGAPETVEWLPMLKRIQSRGKLLLLHDSLAHAETILRELSPEGLLLDVHHCPSEDDARELLEKAKGWGKKS